VIQRSHMWVFQFWRECSTRRNIDDLAVGWKFWTETLGGGGGGLSTLPLVDITRRAL
jgi:hypothetical protein